MYATLLRIFAFFDPVIRKYVNTDQCTMYKVVKVHTAPVLGLRSFYGADS